MSVISSYLLGADTKLSLDEFGRATVTKKFLVTTNSDSDYEYTVAIQSTSATPDPVPQLLTQYNGDHGAGEITGTTDTCAWLLKKEVVRVLNDESDRRKWYVTCTWGPLPIGYAGGLGYGTGTGYTSGPVLPSLSNPLSDPVMVRSEYEHFRRKVEFDLAGSAIVNSAGDPLFAEIDDIRPVLVFTKNMASAGIIDQLAQQFKNATNSDTFRGHAPNTLKIASIQKGHLQERRPMGGDSIQFVPMIVRIHKTEVAVGSLGTDEYWTLKLADRGGQHLEQIGTGTGYRKVWPKVTAGSSAGEFLDIVNLNSDGTRKADGLPPSTKSFTVFPSLPFSSLGIS